MTISSASGSGLAGSESGLVLITSSTFSAVSSVSVNNCFTSTYDVYRITLTLTQPTGASVFSRLRLRANGTDASTNYVTGYVLARSTGVLAGGLNTGQSEFDTPFGEGQYAVPGGIVLDLVNPYLSIATTLNVYATTTTSSSTQAVIFNWGRHTTASSYDGFTIFNSSAAAMTGTVRVYGYRNS